ncbi:hypothetical protein EV182_001587 [Spiromyces aspiralis]|uniref:Uncharacterized protein n=1 Tax=Spiromyces aspiralis TaxID=68401 RepID=A0ACC1HHR3_9FUNG|nr:hypothetical protein EV182_001587 [Spiromyces aspiralis]
MSIPLRAAGRCIYLQPARTITHDARPGIHHGKATTPAEVLDSGEITVDDFGHALASVSDVEFDFGNDLESAAVNSMLKHHREEVSGQMKKNMEDRVRQAEVKAKETLNRDPANKNTDDLLQQETTWSFQDTWEPGIPKEERQMMEDMLRGSKKAAKDAYEQGKQSTKDAYEQGKQTYEQGKQSTKETYEQGKQTAKDTYEQGKRSAKESYENVKQSGRDMADKVKSKMQQ